MTNNRKDKKRRERTFLPSVNTTYPVSSLCFSWFLFPTVNETGSVPDFPMYRGETVNKYPNRHVWFSDGRYGENNLRGVLGAVLLDREFRKAPWRKCVPMETQC